MKNMIKYYLKNYFSEIFLTLTGIAGLVLGFVVSPYWFSVMFLNVGYTALNIRTIKKLNLLLKKDKPCGCYNEYDL